MKIIPRKTFNYNGLRYWNIQRNKKDKRNRLAFGLLVIAEKQIIRSIGRHCPTHSRHVYTFRHHHQEI